MVEPYHSSQRQVRLLRSAAVTGSGIHVKLDWKAWLYVSGDVFWELRRVVSDFYAGSVKNNDVKAFFKENERLLSAFLDVLGMRYDDHFEPSMRSYCTNIDDPITDPFVRHECSVSTLGIVTWLLRWARSRRRVEDKAVCRAMLGAFLSATIPSGACSFDRVAQLCKSQADACAEYDMNSGRMCRHLRHAIKDLDFAGADSDWCLSRFVQLCVCLQEELTCPAVVGSLAILCEEVACCIDTSMPDLTLSDDIRTVSHLSGSSKRRRIDEDFKEVISVGLTFKKKCHSGSQFLHVASDIDERLARNWETRAVANELAACRRSVTCLGVTFVLEDASRNGKPAEDTQIYMLWDAKVNLGAVLPPMVPDIPHINTYANI